MAVKAPTPSAIGHEAALGASLWILAGGAVNRPILSAGVHVDNVTSPWSLANRKTLRGQTSLNRTSRPIVRELDAFLEDTGHRRPQAGDLVGRHRLLKILGSGKFGIIWEAQDSSSDGTIAVKIFQPESFTDKVRRAAAERFHEGAAAMLRLRGKPQIVEIYEGPQISDGFLWFSMKLYPERDLARWSSRHPTSFAVVRDLVSDVLSALESAHGEGVIHRDVRPENIVIDSSNNKASAILIDFDIAYYEDELRSRESTAVLLGVSRYLPPDVLSAPSESVAEVLRWPDNDLYALAVTFFELLCGLQVPINRKPEVLQQHLSFASKKAGDWPKGIAIKSLARFFSVAFAAERTDRFSNVAAFRAQLERALAQSYGAVVGCILLVAIVTDGLIITDWVWAATHDSLGARLVVCSLAAIGVAGPVAVTAALRKLQPRFHAAIVRFAGRYRNATALAAIALMIGACALVPVVRLFIRMQTVELSNAAGCAGLDSKGELVFWLTDGRAHSLNVREITRVVCPKDAHAARLTRYSWLTPDVPIADVAKLQIPIRSVSPLGPTEISIGSSVTPFSRRLYGVDSFGPPVRDPGARLRTALESLLSARSAQVQFPAQVDNSVELWVSDKNVGAELVESGFARAKSSATGELDYAKLETRASEAHLGLWADMAAEVERQKALAACPEPCCHGVLCEAKATCEERWSCEVCKGGKHTWRLRLDGVDLGDSSKWAEVRVCFTAGQRCGEQTVRVKEAMGALGVFDCSFTEKELRSVSIKVVATANSGGLKRLADLQTSFIMGPATACHGFALKGFEDRDGHVSSLRLSVIAN